MTDNNDLSASPKVAVSDARNGGVFSGENIAKTKLRTHLYLLKLP